jgi:hypothetical protein
MANLWHWLIANWGPLGIGTGIGVFFSAAFSLFKWKYPSGAEWSRAKQEQKVRDLDAKVLQSLASNKMPRSSRGMTGAGLPISRPAEIAAYLEVDRDAVEESLSRLEMRNRAATDHGDWWPLPD